MADGMLPSKPEGLELLRMPFPENQISKLPKPTKHQTESLKAAIKAKDWSVGIRCQLCGQYHHKDVIHLDYVGHAALTDRLLDCDPNWNWEPMSYDANGLPALDNNGGMWIRLTVCGVTRPGYGDAPGKNGGDAIKEVIGDALRNAAMRFGAALDLWHKGDLHGPDDSGENEADRQESADNRNTAPPAQKDDQEAKPVDDRTEGNKIHDWVNDNLSRCASLEKLDAFHEKHAERINALAKSEKHWFMKIVELFTAARNRLNEAEPEFEDAH
ncbi:hypothetical protein [Ponticaulis sp.]|uniref:hypothetical protein n=1 Tax=Ponticaulis sp. TaxID=2020902 RepID=UPI0025F058FF|nr:hypothetical protein [Ponticaulis sp.]